MKILFVASEGAPFIKTGGLGDVIGSLPKALQGLGLDVRVILPKYSNISMDYIKNMKFIKTINVPLSWRNQGCDIYRLEHQGIKYYFLKNSYYFDRPNIYGHYDEAERYAFFSKAVLEAIPHIRFKPQLIHCHDWQTGLVGVFLNRFFRDISTYQNIKTIYTIHNLKFQGVFPQEILGDLLGLEDEYFTIDKLEFNGQVNYMKGGIAFSDIVTTVSKTYAEEIKYPFFGEGLDGFLETQGHKVLGITNGIDYHEFNPETDHHIYTNFSNSSEGKGLNKAKLQEELGLPQDPSRPLLAITTRLTDQKGLDLLSCILDELMALDVQLCVLGCGEKKYEDLFREKAYIYPEKLSANLYFSEGLARKIYAGSDLFLMPSLFEPCGLSQLIALRYGTIPIVRETGGLKDTIEPFNQFTGKGNGFSFANYNAHDFLHTIKYALQIYGDKALWHQLIANSFASNFSWDSPAKEYNGLYEKLIKKTQRKVGKKNG